VDRFDRRAIADLHRNADVPTNPVHGRAIPLVLRLKLLPYELTAGHLGAEMKA